jgi:glycogen synthase
MFILHLFLSVISYDVIFKLWPLILIGLGVEVLASNLKTDSVIDDKAAIVLMFILAFFAMCMAGADLMFQYFVNGQMF